MLSRQCSLWRCQLSSFHVAQREPHAAPHAAPCELYAAPDVAPCELCAAPDSAPSLSGLSGLSGPSGPSGLPGPEVSLAPEPAVSQQSGSISDPVATAIVSELDVLMDPTVEGIQGAHIAFRDLIQDFYARRAFRPSWCGRARRRAPNIRRKC